MSEPVPPAYSTSSTTAANGKKTMGILSLVFGLVALALAWIFPIIWILLAVAGVVLGFLSRKRESAGGIAVAGIIISFIAIAANIASMVIGAVLVTQMLQQ